MRDDQYARQFIQIFLEEARDWLNDWERHCLGLASDNSVESCAALFRAAHNLKGSARSVGLDAYAAVIHTAEDIITLVRDGHTIVTKEIIQALLEAQQVLIDWCEGLAKDPAHVPESKAHELRQKLAKLKTSLAGEQRGGELAWQAWGHEDEPGAASSPRPAAGQMSGTPASARRPNAKGASQASGESLRVPAVRIDALMQIIGELSTQQSTIVYCLKTRTMDGRMCNNAVSTTSKLVRELQVQTMALRLVDLSILFQRLERVARDLANEQGKDIAVEACGTEVELDKSVVDRITDPLIHMIRNAVDHGIEKTSERGSKPITAKLKISASQNASGVTIEITDDGRGIDTDAVLQKAISQGLVSREDRLTPEMIYEFLFVPGFSTAKLVTDISGRGVGLDVVKRAIDELDGSIEVSSQKGHGTHFNLHVPTNVSIVDSLIVLSNGDHYVIPIQEVSEVIDVRSHQVEAKTAQTSTIALRDSAITVCNLANFMPKNERRSAADPLEEQVDGPLPAMIVDVGACRVGFTVEQVLGQQPILIRKLGGYIAGIPGLAGSTVLATGEPALIVSPKVFARRFIAEKGEK